MDKEKPERVEPKFKSEGISYRPLDYPSKEFGDNYRSGWVCPVCNNVWSPDIDSCPNCSNNVKNKDTVENKESVEK